MLTFDYKQMQSQQEDHRQSQQQHPRRQQLEEACQPNKKDEEHREDSICMAAVGSAMQLCAGLRRIRGPTAGLYILVILPRVCTHSMKAVVTMLKVLHFVQKVAWSVAESVRNRDLHTLQGRWIPSVLPRCCTYMKTAIELCNGCSQQICVDKVFK